MKKGSSSCSRPGSVCGLRRLRHRVVERPATAASGCLAEHRPDGRERPGSSRRSIALAKKAGLAGALSTKTLTVFAPTDAAFAKVPKSTLDALAKDKSALKSVLLYHVIAGKVPASNVVKLRSAKTLEGSKVEIASRAARSTSTPRA